MNNASMQYLIIRNLNEFALFSRQWNELWEKSRVTSPCCRAENLAAAIRSLWHDQEIFIVAVFHENQMVAGLPLVGTPIAQGMEMLQSLQLPNNEWGCWGDLLVDRDFEIQSTIASLLEAFDQLPHYLMMRFKLIADDQPQWQLFLKAFETKQGNIQFSPAYDVGIIEHEPSWDHFESRLSKGFRKKLKKYGRKLSESGEIEVEVVKDFHDLDVESVIRRVFDIEDRSWKSGSDTTIESQGMAKLFVQQAVEFARQGSLVISFLKIDGKDIAFDLGMVGKRTYHSWKIGFDQRYAAAAPGQFLTRETTLHFHQTGDCDFQDTLGPISSATASWASSTKALSSITVPGNLPGVAIGLKFLFAFRSLLQSKSGQKQQANAVQNCHAC